jgi:predicted metal-dependent hydrolase
MCVGSRRAPHDRLLITEARRSIGLAGGRIDYLLRRSARSRGLRMTIHPRHGLVVSIPPPQRRGWAGAMGEARVEAFVREREGWVRRHLGHLDRERAEVHARGGIRDGGSILFRGEVHAIRIIPAAPAARRSTVERSGADGGDELVIRSAARDRRAPERVLEAWLRARAGEVIDQAIGRYAAPLGVRPILVDLRDPRTRWGSASKQGRLMFSWRLVLAPPDALETVVVHELAHLKVFGHGPRFWALVASARPTHLADRAWLRKRSHELHAALDSVDELDRAV